MAADSRPPSAAAADDSVDALLTASFDDDLPMARAPEEASESHDDEAEADQEPAEEAAAPVADQEEEEEEEVEADPWFAEAEAHFADPSLPLFGPAGDWEADFFVPPVGEPEGLFKVRPLVTDLEEPPPDDLFVSEQGGDPIFSMPKPEDDVPPLGPAPAATPTQESLPLAPANKLQPAAPSPTAPLAAAAAPAPIEHDIDDADTDISAVLSTSLPMRRVPRVAKLVAGFALAALALGTCLVPSRAIDAADAALAPCRAEDAVLRAAPFEGCLPGGTAFEVASALPYYGGRADALRAEAEHRVAELRFLHASVVEPDAQKRTDAARKLLDHAEDFVATADALPGAFEAIAAASHDREGKDAPRRGEVAARVLGDLPLQKRLAARAVDPEDSWRSVRQGALRCFAGDLGGGLETLGAVAGVESSRAAGLAALARRACDGADPLRLAGLTPDVVPPVVALAQAQEAPLAEEAARQLLDKPAGLDPVERWRIGVGWLGHRQPARSLVETTLAGASSPRLLDQDLVTPWVDGRDGALLTEVDDEAFARAATRLETLAAEDDCDDACRARLRHWAQGMWLDAGRAQVRRGRDARETLHHALMLLPKERRFLLAGDALAAGDARGALALADAPEARPTPEEDRRLDVVRALAYASLGHFPAAHRVAGAALRYQSRLASPLPLGTPDPVEEEHVALAWIYAATSLQTNQGGDAVAFLRSQESTVYWKVAQHVEIALRDEPARREARLAYHPEALATAALPAVIHVYAQWLPEEADPEPWLDRVLATEHRRHPLRLARARAEAARWRGDNRAADRWAERAHAIERALRDYPQTVLAALADIR
ncbi:MAG: hypothetical protein R3B72_50605 [Polyangiaceae bacterium]